MQTTSLPEGWRKIDELHPEHGVVAYSHARFKHEDGTEVMIWSSVVEDAADYSVDESDEYAVEVYSTSGDYIEGNSFETEDAARQAAQEAMDRFPQNK